MKKLLLIVAAAASLAGCMNWDEEAAALRQRHVPAVVNAAATNLFTEIPAAEEVP